jgi:hypothetical protein
LAASPLTAAGNPFIDLLFSPRAAFIWDQTRQTIVWMNAAARAKFALSLEGLSGALPKSLINKFTEYLAKAGSGQEAARAVKLKIARHPAFDFSLDALELASGHSGLAVTETATPHSIPVPPLARAASRQAGPAKPQPKREKTGAAAGRALKRPKTAAPQLTPDELRSFKAIGRAVRKLCREKRLAPAPALVPSYALPPVEPKKPSSGRVQTLPGVALSAFDTVLLLDKKLDIAGVEGRPQSLGWRKTDLLGRPAGQLLLAGERGFFCRMVNKLNNTAAQSCRDTIAVADGTGTGVPCRAVLGYWEHGNAHYFLALLALRVPQRLKKLKYQPVNISNITRLAA